MDIEVLKKLPKNTEPELVEKLYRKALEEESWGLWAALKHVRDEHVAVVMKVLAEDTEHSQAKLVRAGHANDGAAGMRAAGEWFAYVRSSTNLPGLLKRLKKEKAKFAALVPVAKDAIAASLAGEEPDTLTFWGLVFLVAAKNDKDSLLAQVRDANERWGDEYGVLARVTDAARASK